MGESVERYANQIAEQRARQVAMQTLIEEWLQFGIEKERIMDRLCEKFSLSPELAEEVFEAYAPMTV